MASPGLNIDLRDPRVSSMMGTDGRVSSGNPDPHGNRELVQLAGDPAYDQRVSENERGLAAQQTIRMTESAQGHPRIYYKGKAGEFVIEGDLYAFPGEPMKLVILCPKCSMASGQDHALTITSDKKAMEYDPRGGAPGDGGRLSVETFECTWELESGKKVDRNENISIVMGANLCRWKVAIDHNIARDA